MPRKKDPTPYLFLCNGASLTSRAKVWKKTDGRELRTDPKSGNIELRIGEISETLSANVPPRAADLIEIAACVYVADQMARRLGGEDDYGDRWYRDMRIEFAVRDPDFWGQEHIAHRLEETLHFMSGDDFEVGFSKGRTPTPLDAYLPFRRAAPNPEGIESVMLFSGGLDSLAGAVHRLLEQKQNVAMVSHKPVSHMASLQRKLVEGVQAAAASEGLDPVAVSVWAKKAGLRERDHTQRTRSFLYVALGAVVARIFGLDAVDFFENGVVSVNLPLARHEFGGRATRTTHPQTLANFQHLLTAVFESDFCVHNEFLWKTKQDVVELIANANQGHLIPTSVSCIHTIGASQSRSHCGLCSQCISRRIATLGSVPQQHDPSSIYRADVLTAPRTKTEERIIAERLLGLAQHFRTLPDVDAFGEAFANELSRITPYVPLASSDTIAKLFDLHVQHAEQVESVITASMAEHVGAYRSGDLDATSMIMYAFAQPLSNSKQQTESPDNAPSPDDGELVLTRNEAFVLAILADATGLLIQAEIKSESEVRNHSLSIKTIGKCLKTLADAGLAEYPKGDRGGVRISTPGRRFHTQSASI